MTRTSTSHPLVIATLSVGGNGGEIGITFAPGKYQEAAMTGSWARDLDQDLGSIVNWGARHLVTLIEPWEFEELRISDLPQRAEDRGLVWHGLPITDGAAPDERLLERWQSLGPRLTTDLLAGAKVIVHCKGGLGRAGTVAAMLLLQAGAVSGAADAISKVRRARPGAIETEQQEDFVKSWARSYWPPKLGRS
ncbi:cyclin-dependent kinase inhibitor 3 family protein [Stenotrophomonas maltophilia]|nr:cyclin-dependent kinase inhibitor 3 family protein [Stenotrophomonas maltophilia]MCU0991437.1 cyclin-dependent kinase inhibitor 3 family protein [Stenotrophomonas maltophilia]MCU1134046.1 cyclin-dependent kinase inhibitor 3 family protein [Stenotrophomonas maltophilia]